MKSTDRKLISKSLALNRTSTAIDRWLFCSAVRPCLRLEVYPDMVGINFLLADGQLGFMPIDSGVEANRISAIGASKTVILPFKNKKPAEYNLSIQNLRAVNSGDDG